MNMTVLILEKCYNTGNYTSMRVGGEWAIQEGEDLAVSARLASIQCDRMFAEALQASKEEAEKQKKEAEEHVAKQASKQATPMPISVDDSRFAYCLKRLHEGVSLEEMTSKVSFDAVALDTLVSEERKIKEEKKARK
jgi:hypothetical protein